MKVNEIENIQNVCTTCWANTLWLRLATPTDYYYYYLHFSRHHYSLWLDVIKYLLQCDRAIFYTVEVNEDEETCGASRKLWREGISHVQSLQYMCPSSLLAE